jgi:hypothetical protein
MLTEKQKKEQALKARRRIDRNKKPTLSEGEEYISKKPNENDRHNDQDHIENFDYDKAKGLK